MDIGIFTHQDDPSQEALYRLGREFRLHEHKVQFRNSHTFLPNEIEKFHGIFLSSHDHPNDKVIEAYEETPVNVFILENSEEGFFIGESPKVTLREMRTLVEFLTDDNSD